MAGDKKKERARKPVRVLSPWTRVALVLILLAGITLLARQLALPNPEVPLSALQPLSLAGYQRLLILAPHCDDETLSSAGLILAARRAGIQVRVVIATNGDGFLFATMQDFHKIYPTHADFVRMGALRQQESLTALAKLGLSSQQVTFLSYPDRGTPALWDTYWSAGKPYRSPYSGDSRSPYQLTYNRQSVYAGADYLADLTSILESYRPDLVVYPHPDDIHPDHWGLNVFTRLALTLVRHKAPSFNPTELTYLVHRPDFPEVRGYKPQDGLIPPASLYAIYPDWYQFDLTPGDENLKNQAVQSYRSQLPLLRGLLESFVRTDELFAPVTYPYLATFAQGNPRDPSTWLDAAGKPIPPAQLDPVNDTITRSTLPAGDLTAVYVARDAQNNLQVCAQVQEEAVPEITYVLRIKVLTGQGSGILSLQARTGRRPAGWLPVQRSGAYACTNVTLTDLGMPWAVYVGAATSSGGRTMDESAWQMIYVNR